MEKILIEMDGELKRLAEAVVDLVGGITRFRAEALAGGGVDYRALEADLATKTAEVERAAHLAALQALEVDYRQVTIDGDLYARVGRSEATYNTAAGPVVVERALFRKVGVRNDRVVDAISLRAGVVGDGWLPGAAKAMAYLLQQGTSRDAANTAREMGRLPYSRSSFERVGHAVGELYAVRHPEIEQALIEAMEIPDEARSVSVSLDRVSVPVEEPRPRGPGRPARNAPKRPIIRSFRMAYCGTVTLHDAKGEALHTIRYGRMPNGDAVGLCEGLADDVRSMLERRPDLVVSLLADGAPEMWNLLDAQLCPAQLGGRPVHRLIDLFHLLEKLGAAAKVVHADGSSSAVKRWHLRLLNDSKAALRIAKELEHSGMRDVRVGESRPVHEAITYIENNHDRMDYASAIAEGRPVGSGNVEATCKSLVALRMKRSGSRWKEKTGEEVLHLRALALSDRWASAMGLTLPRPCREVRHAA